MDANYWGFLDSSPRRSRSPARPKTLLDCLRQHTTVDCDTLDVSVPQTLGPFEDCTSNQAIAYGELQEHRHKDLVRKSAHLAKSLLLKFEAVSFEALAVEIGVCLRFQRLTCTLTTCR